MRKLYVLLSFLLLAIGGFAQITVTVTGTSNITPALQSSYPSLSSALAALNAATAMSGPVVLTCASGAETAPPAGFTIGSATLDPLLSATNTVTLRAGSGTVTLNAGIGIATPSSAIPDGILKLVGADYVTISGLTFTDGNATNPASMEYGIGLFKLSAANGAQNNRIENCTINLPRVNNANSNTPMFDGSVGILAVAALSTSATSSLTPTSAAGTNSFNKFYGNTINGGNTGIGLSGFAATSGFPTPPLGDQGNDIGGPGAPGATTGNTILNYGGAPSAGNGAAGIRANQQWGLTISNNTVNNNNGSGFNHPTTLRGIYAQAGNGANLTISYNTISVKSAATTEALFAIENAIGSTASSNTVNIANNLIQNCTYTTATTAEFIGIYSTSTASTINITGNQILGNTVGAAGRSQACKFSGIFAASTPVAVNMTNNTVSNNSLLNSFGDFYGIRSGSADISLISGNDISNNTIPNSAGSTASTLCGIYNSSSPNEETFAGNNIYNLSISGTSTGTAHEIYGIYNPTSSVIKATFTGNNINNLSFASSTANGVATVAGLRLAGGSTVTVSRNTVHTLTSTGATPLVIGLHTGSSGVGSVTASNNIIGKLSTPASTGANLHGIYTGNAGSVVNLYYNTVYLDATGTGNGFGSSAVFFSATVPTVTLRNNLLVNLSTPTGSGLTAVIRRGNANLNSYGSASNNNLLYAGAPASNRLLYYDGTNADQTLAAFKTRVASRESASFTETVSSSAGVYFQSLTGPTTGASATFLHLASGLQTSAEGGAVNISGITDDYDGQVRAGNSGYTGTGSAPDIGADEFNGILRSSSCAPVTAPYTEGFESIAVANTLPTCILASPAPVAGGKTQTFVTAVAGNPTLSARTGSKFVAVVNRPNGGGYFFSAPLQLTAGTTYQASVYYKTDGVAWPVVGLTYGTSPSVASMTNNIATLNNAGATAYTQVSGTFTPAATGVYYVSFYADNTNYDFVNYIVFDDFSVDVAPACTTPQGLVLTTTGINTATLSWAATTPAPAGGYEFYYSTSPTPPTAGTAPSLTGIAATSQVLNGLSASTTYYVWARNNCGANGTSNWSSSPLTLTTLCLAADEPYVENFDASTPPVLPACTSVEDVNKDGSTWATVNATTGYSGRMLQYSANVFNAANDWFFTRGINLVGGNTYTLTFKFGNNSSIYTESMKVAYGTSPTSGAMTTLLQDYPSINNGVVSSATIVFTPASSGVYYIGFQAYSAANRLNIYLDDIALNRSGGCATPTGGAVLNVSATTATIGWNGTGNFILEYGPTGFTPGTGATAGTSSSLVVTPATSPQTISGLSSATSYDVYLRQNCTATGGGFSANSVKLTLTTTSANDEAVDAVTLTQSAYSATCGSVQFATAGATASSQATSCLAGSIDDDVWFKFTATNTKAILKLANYQPVGGSGGAFAYAVYSGTPASLTELECLSSTVTLGDAELALSQPLTVGEIYYLRVLSTGTGGRSTFNLCVMTPAVSASTTPNTCVTARPVTIAAASGNTSVWVPVYTEDGKIVAEINANGNTLGTVTAKLYRNTSAVRKDNAGRPYMDRNVELATTVQPTTAISVRLYFTVAEYNALRTTQNSQVTNIGDLGVFRNNQLCAAQISGAAFPAVTNVIPYETNYVATFNTSATGSFFIASNNFSILPANLLSFSGLRQGTSNRLQWTVAQERDVQVYDVERSVDGRNFVSVGTVQSVGNAAQHSYSFVDNDIQGVRQHYRLRIVDVNGSVKLSGVVLIQGSRPVTLTLTGLYPNPVSSRLSLQLDAPQKDQLSLMIVDALGKTVRRQAIVVSSGSNNINLDVSGLAQGTYLLKASSQTGDTPVMGKFVKN